MATASIGIWSSDARRNSAKKYEMNATMPMALPRGPNRRTQTAPNSTAMNPTSATLPKRGQQRRQRHRPHCREEEQQGGDDAAVLLAILDRRRGLHCDDRAQHGDRDRLMGDA